MENGTLRERILNYLFSCHKQLCIAIRYSIILSFLANLYIIIGSGILESTEEMFGRFAGLTIDHVAH